MSLTKRDFWWLIVLTVAIVWTHTALALGTGGGGTMPWDTALTALATDLTGPTAFSLSLIALACCGFALAFGGEMNHFVRGVVYVILVVALLSGATTGAAALGIGGAVVI